MSSVALGGLCPKIARIRGNFGQTGILPKISVCTRESICPFERPPRAKRWGLHPWSIFFDIMGRFSIFWAKLNFWAKPPQESNRLYSVSGIGSQGSSRRRKLCKAQPISTTISRIPNTVRRQTSLRIRRRLTLLLTCSI